MNTSPSTTQFLIAMGIFLVASCATAPTTPSGRSALQDDADATLAQFKTRDPSLHSVLKKAAGYAVFPKIGKGGIVVGGAYGRGIVYERGRRIGFVELNQASIGLQLGGQTFSELIVFQNPEALERLKNGSFSVGGQASAIALTKGAGASTQFVDGVAIFVASGGGLMVELSVAGQKLNYAPQAAQAAEPAPARVPRAATP